MTKHSVRRTQKTMTALLLLFFLAISTFGQYTNERSSSSVEQTQVQEDPSANDVLASGGNRGLAAVLAIQSSLDWDFYEVIIDFPGLRVTRDKYLLAHDIARNTFYVFTCINAP